MSMVDARDRNGFAAYAVEVILSGGVCGASLAVVFSTEILIATFLLLGTYIVCDCVRDNRRGSIAPTVLGKV
jgi:hypothetical protein